MPTLLLLGGSLTQLPLVRLAKSRGVTIAVADRRPEAISLMEADIAVPISTLDEDGLIIWGRDHPIDGVFTAGSDRAAPVAARVAAALGLPGLDPEAAVRANDKVAMKQAFVAAGVPTPASIAVRSLEEAEIAAAEIGYPVVMKPSDNAGQRGVKLLLDDTELSAHYPECLKDSPSGVLLVEEYADGPEVAVQTFSVHGTPHVLTITDRLTTPPPFMGITRTHLYPADLKPEEWQAVAQAARRAVDALGLDNCPGYMQTVVTARGPRVIEVAARLGGGRDALIARLTTGVDQYDLVVRAALGETIEAEAVTPRDTESASACSHFLVGGPGGTVALTEGLDDALAMPGVVEAGIPVSVGQVVPPVIKAEARRAFVVVAGASRDDVMTKARAALAKITVLTEEELASGWRPGPDEA
jgi:biotin carboxylase